MLHVYEFEVFEDEGVMIALPFDMDGGTQGADFAEACEMAADWLKTEMEHRAMHGLEFPEAAFGNEPREEGRTVIVAVDAGKEDGAPHDGGGGRARVRRYARARLANGEGGAVGDVRDGRPHLGHAWQRGGPQGGGPHGGASEEARHGLRGKGLV